MIAPVLPEIFGIETDKRHIYHINSLSKIASNIVEPAIGKRVVASVVFKNDVVSYGVNSLKTHPFQAKFSKHPEAIYLHAEIAAIKNSLKKLSLNDLEKSTLYVCRVKYDENGPKMFFGLSKPCSGCVRCISTFNIKSVIYTLDGIGFAKL